MYVYFTRGKSYGPSELYEYNASECDSFLIAVLVSNSIFVSK